MLKKIQLVTSFFSRWFVVAMYFFGLTTFVLIPFENLKNQGIWYLFWSPVVAFVGFLLITMLEIELPSNFQQKIHKINLLFMPIFNAILCSKFLYAKFKLLEYWFYFDITLFILSLICTWFYSYYIKLSLLDLKVFMKYCFVPPIFIAMIFLTIQWFCFRSLSVEIFNIGFVIFLNIIAIATMKYIVPSVIPGLINEFTQKTGRSF